MLQHYLFENHWPLAIVTIAIGLFLIRRSLVTRRKTSGYVGVGILLVGVGVAIVGWRVETPAEQVDRVLDDLVAAGLRRDVTMIERHIGGGFQQDGLTKAILVERLRREFENFTPQSLKFNGRELRKDGDKIVADFVAVTSGQYRQTPINFYPIRTRATFEKSGETWQIVRLQRFDPTGNMNRELPLFSR